VTWFRVDDDLPTHRKVLSIPRGPRRLTAVGGWTLAGAWSSGALTDGHIDPHVIEEFAITSRVVDDLLASGLWTPNGNGYVMHDYLDWNPSAEKVITDRATAAERQRKAREAAAKKRADEGGHA
jgi:hypothetical protein